MRIKLHELLNEKQQNDLYEIALDFKKRIKSKEITYAEAFSEIKYGRRMRDWFSSIENIEEVYDSFLPLLHNKLLKAYKKIIEPFIEEGVLIASNAGTQLGLMRDGKIIDWDDDIDLLMDVKDFNKYKSKIRRRALKHGWILWTRDWLDNDLMPRKKNNYIWVKLFSIKGIKLDFGKFKTTFYPFIDIFPGIRVSKKLTQEENEEITLSLVEYYDSCNRRLIDKLINNKRFEKDANSYHLKLKQLDKNGICSKENQYLLKDVLNKYYDNKGEMLFQLNVAAPIFETFDYTSRSTKNINIHNENYKFIYADNYIDHFNKEYGQDMWQKPRRTHSHFLLPWFFKFK